MRNTTRVQTNIGDNHSHTKLYQNCTLNYTWIMEVTLCLWQW